LPIYQEILIYSSNISLVLFVGEC